MISLLIIDDHQMVRLGLTSYFAMQEDIKVIGEAVNGVEGVDLALEYRPDIILMDLVMEEMDGIKATQEILQQWPEAKIIILTSFIDDEKVFPAMEAGASGYLLKTSSASEIAQAVRKTNQGDGVFESQVTEKMMRRSQEADITYPHDELTGREFEVLQLITKGFSNQEIADELYITLKTVKTHVSNVLSKLEVSDRTQAAIYAYQHDIVE